MAEIKELLISDASLTDSALKKYISALTGEEKDFKVLFDSMRYSLENGGKRIRPFLAIEFCRMTAANLETGSEISEDEIISAAMPFAAAIEFIHTYSLIHDDLPCMDDDEMRRGKPCNHKVFGEAGALLAGDALLTAAFGVASENEYVSDSYIVRMIKELSAAAGPCGMVGGQQLDLIGETKKLNFETLLKLHSKKTGELIRISCVSGCLAALGLIEKRVGKTDYDKVDKIVADAEKYAHGIGLSFQIIDDILDCTATEEQLGKSVGSDAEHQKTTFLTFMDIENARKYAEELTRASSAAIEKYCGADKLTAFAEYLLTRNY